MNADRPPGDQPIVVGYAGHETPRARSAYPRFYLWFAVWSCVAILLIRQSAPAAKYAESSWVDLRAVAGILGWCNIALSVPCVFFSWRRRYQMSLVLAIALLELLVGGLGILLSLPSLARA